MVKKIFAFGLACFLALATAHSAGAQYRSGQESPTTGQSRPYWQDQGPSNRDREMRSQQQATQEQNDPYRAEQPGRPAETGQDQAAPAGQGESATTRPGQRQGYFSSEKSKKQEAASMYLDASKLMGAKVKDRNGKDAGSVFNLILDRSGKVVYVIVSEGGFAGMGAKKISVPAGAVTVSGAGDKVLFTVNVDEEQLNSAPEYNNLADLSNRLYSETIYRFFGLQPQWSDEGQGAAAQQRQGSLSPQSAGQNQWQYQDRQRPQGQLQEKSGK